MNYAPYTFAFGETPARIINVTAAAGCLAGVRGGWHPYLVSVPYQGAYTIRTTGRCSLIARHVGVSLPGQDGGAT